MNKFTIQLLNKSLFSKSCSFVNHSTWKNCFATVANQRNPKYEKLTENHVQHFTSLLGKTGVITDESDLEQYNKDWMHKFEGKSSICLRPKTTQQVSDILKYCNNNNLAVVPQGGNTGLVGGSVPVFDEIILSLQLMNKIESFNKTSGIVVTQSGVVLQKLDTFLEEHDCTVPIDLGAKGSCHIGGNVATNAGGIRLLKYGSLHGTVLGLEVVLPNGEILDNLNVLRKDNTGYDLKQLFIGSEGTLGVITKIALLTPPKPKNVTVAFLALSDFSKIKDIFISARTKLSETLSAFEFVDRPSVELVLKHSEGIDPFSEKHPQYILIETSSQKTDGSDVETLENWVSDILENDDNTDAVISQDLNQLQNIWKLREGVSEALGKAGKVYKYDLSLPVEHFYDLVEVMRERIGDKGNVVGYGHIGDSNLHLNISVPKLTEELQNLIEPFVYEYIEKHRGSISAEHGLGVMKNQYLKYSKSDLAISLMQKTKDMFDPNGIMNPYKFLPNKS